MFNLTGQLCKKLASLNFWRSIVFVGILFAACGYGFSCLDNFLGYKTPDSLFGFSVFFYTPQCVQTFFNDIKSNSFY